MSKPDRQLTLIEAFRYFKIGELNELEAEEEIKALLLDLLEQSKDKMLPLTWLTKQIENL